MTLHVSSVKWRLSGVGEEDINYHGNCFYAKVFLKNDADLYVCFISVVFRSQAYLVIIFH